MDSLHKQTASHNDDSVHLRDVKKKLIPSLKNIAVIDNFFLHSFPFNIDFVIFGRFLWFKLS